MRQMLKIRLLILYFPLVEDVEENRVLHLVYDDVL